MFGHALESAIELPELLGSPRTNTKATMEISQGVVPNSLSHPTAEGVLFQADRDRVLLWLPGSGRFLIEAGQRIIAEPAPTAAPEDVRAILLGPCLAALAHQRGLLVLDGSAVESQGQSVVFVGNSTPGKSTLAFGLHQRGFKALCDELAVFELIDGEPHLCPSVPRLKLWDNVLKALQVDATVYPLFRPSIPHRRSLPIQPLATSLPVREVLFFSVENLGQHSISEVAPLERMLSLWNLIYQAGYHKGNPKHPNQLALIQALAKSKAHRSLVRRKSIVKALPEWLDFVETAL
jgi:hypothetical protein